MKKYNKSFGFTLIELLIALSILSVVTVIIFSGFRVSVRAWERGERDIDVEQRSRTALNLMRRQLSSIDMHKNMERNNQKIYLEGDNKSAAFLSAISLTPGYDYGTVYVKYQVQKSGSNKEDLLIYEANLAVSKFSEISVGENEYMKLIKGVESISFEYIGEKDIDEQRGWKTIWNPEIERAFPRGVKITLKKFADSVPISMIARIQKMRIDES